MRKHKKTRIGVGRLTIKKKHVSFVVLEFTSTNELLKLCVFGCKETVPLPLISHPTWADAFLKARPNEIMTKVN